MSISTANFKQKQVVTAQCSIIEIHHY